MTNRRPSLGTGLGTVLLLCAAFGAPTQATGWKDLPEDVVLAVHFDMRSLAASELYQSLVDQYGSGIPNPKPEYMEFIEATGFDSVGRSMAAQNPQAAGILQHLELARDGSNVEIRISMSGADVRAALQQSHAIADD